MASARAILGALERRLMAPTDAASLAAFRALVGALVLIGVLRFLIFGWVERFFVEPTFTFKYWGFEWLALPPPWAMIGIFVAMAAMAACLALGLFTRLSALGLFALFTAVELLDVTNYLNHYYILSLLLFLMIFLPVGRTGSLDALRRPELRRDTTPTWVMALLRFQVGVVYVLAGLAKFGQDWLIHAQPLNIWLSARVDLPLIGPWLDLWSVALVMSWGGFLFDTTIPFWLLWRRTRPVAYVVLIAFHLTVGALFNIGMFPPIMICAATIFFDPSWPRRLAARLRRAPHAEASDPRGARSSEGEILRSSLAGEEVAADAAEGALRRAPAGRPKPWAVGALAIYCALQVIVPLRFLAYPGSVLWHEQGMRWSWRVMVREKNGSVMYRVHLPDSGRTTLVPPGRYLTDHQAREMSGQPDMILQLGHHIGQAFLDAGHSRVEVRVDAQVSLNGRPPALLVDPHVDLMTLKDGLAPAAWIMPGPTTPPIRLDRAAR